MIKYILSILFLACFHTFSIFGQITEVSVELEQHELFTILNFEGDQYKLYSSEFEEKFTEISKTYDTPSDLVIIQYFSRDKKPIYSYHSKPVLAEDFKNKLDSAFSEIDPIYTTLTDFQSTYKCKLNGGNKNRKAIYTPAIPKLRNLSRESYKNQTLENRVLQTKNWVNEVAIPILKLELQNSKHISTDINRFSNSLDAIFKNDSLSTEQKFDHNANYWLANDQLVEFPTLLPALKLMSYVQEGRFEYGQWYAQILYNYSTQESIIIYLLTELSWRMAYCIQKQEEMYRNAKQLHQANLIDSAKNEMDKLLQANPNSSIGFSKYLNFNINHNYMDVKQHIFGQQTNYAYLLHLNPFSIDTIPATNKVEAYQNGLRLIIYDYFVDPSRIEGDYERFANKALELKSYGLAAEIFRLLSINPELTSDVQNAYVQKHLFALHQLKISAVDKRYDLKTRRHDKKLKKKLKKLMTKNDRYKNFEK